MNRYFIANGYLYFISNSCVSICLISCPMITTTGSLKTRETLVVSKLTTSHQLKISHPNWNMNSDYTPPRIKMSNYTTNCQTALLFFSYQFLCTQLSHWITKFCSAYLSTCETTATYAKSEMMALFQTNWQTFIVHVFLRTETYCLVCNRCHTTMELDDRNADIKRHRIKRKNKCIGSTLIGGGSQTDGRLLLHLVKLMVHLHFQHITLFALIFSLIGRVPSWIPTTSTTTTITEQTTCCQPLLI